MRYSKRIKEKTILLYKEGNNCAETAEQIGCSTGSVQNWLIEANVARRWPPPFRPDLNRQIVEAYSKDNLCINDIRKRLHCSFALIKQALAESNIPIKPTGGQRHHSIDESFFETIDSEEKAYWVGFILADGCINDFKGWTLVVSLQLGDINHLRKLQAALSLATS